MTSALIQAAELKDLLAQGAVRVLDASYNLPPAPGVIAGAPIFDIDDVADPAAPLAHTVPSPDVFAAKVGALGIGNDDTIVVYDRAGVHMAASRAWWMFRLFGHDKVRVLDGGLPAWIAAGGPLTAPGPAPAPKKFTPRFRPELLKTAEDMLKNIDAADFTVLDARDAARYAGMGHIPGALSAPFAALIDPATGRMRSKDALSGILRPTTYGPLACSCGSGVTACVVALAFHELGRGDVAIYDGSWTEWGADPRLPKTTGENP